MDDALLVRFLERLGDLPGNRQHGVQREGPSCQALGQIVARHVLHGQESHAVALVDAVDGGNVGVIQRGQHLGLALEAGQALLVAGEHGGQDLDRHVPVQGVVGRPPHRPHAALPDLRRQAVVEQDLAGLQAGP